jgi:hypothetical protein
MQQCLPDKRITRYRQASTGNKSRQALEIICTPIFSPAYGRNSTDDEKNGIRSLSYLVSIRSFRMETKYDRLLAVISAPQVLSRAKERLPGTMISPTATSQYRNIP